MNITVAWDNPEHSIIRVTLMDGWTWEQAYTVNDKIRGMMDSTDQTVHVMVDHTRTPAVPISNAIMNARNILRAHPSNLGVMIIVSRNQLARRLVEIFQATFRTPMERRVHLASSFEEAYCLARKYDRKMPDLVGNPHYASCIGSSNPNVLP